MNDAPKLKATGSSVWVQEDSEPFWVTEAPDIVIDKIEDALDAHLHFVALTGYHANMNDDQARESGEPLATRTFYVKPTAVVAVSQRLVEIDD